MTDYRDAEACLKHLRMDNKTKDQVGGILRYSKQLIEEREPAVREAIFKQGTEQMAYIFDFLEVECKAREAVTGIPISARKRHLALLKNMFDRIIENGDPTSLKDLKVSGNDLMKYGFKGREIGQMLEKLMYAVMDNPKINDKDTLLGMLDILK
jgi:tRNA nucleotidyltransferase (CCA-adding enzyme)